MLINCCNRGFDKPGTSADLCLLPPDKDELTDDSDDDEETLLKNPNHQTGAFFF